MNGNTLTREDRNALFISVSLHVVMLVFFIFYHFTVNDPMRTSFIEVELGEFKSGKPAQYAEKKAEKVATQPKPSETQPEEPQQKTPEPKEEKQNNTKENTKSADLPDQKEDVKEEPVKTPKTEKVDPKAENSNKEEKEVSIPPKTEKGPVKQEGAESSGDKRGNTGDLNADQGAGNEQNKQSPYDLRWEGDIERAPVVQPLPDNNTGDEAVITVRFEVKPNGTVGRIIPLKKMNPELEREVMKTLRNWRFSRLPSGIPQESQWGTITFHFVLD